ncbi:MAG: cytochrome P450 [Boseongicola sp. SB0667_bin_21]|nr:cytochrome P450 [Boseongicola sp. SB0667_bin_21]
MSFSPAAALRSALASPILLRERWRSGIVYNPLSARMAQDPYPSYAALRARDPVHRSLLVNGWVLTRHADIDAILRDHRRFSNDPRQGTLSARQLRRLPASEDFTLIFLDPPDHTRLRALVNKAFTRNAVAAIEARIRTTLGALLDDIAHPSGFDLVTAIAQPLPMIVVAEMLGVPPEDRDRFKLWSARRARLLEPTIGRRERRRAAAAMIAFDAYFREIIAERRKAPRDDIVSALAQVEEEGERLSEREMLNMLRLLLIAGNETTTNLIGNGILALLRNPEQLQRLRDDPSLIPDAVEELLRFDAPVQADFRYVLSDCEVNGFPLRRRDNLLLLLGSANRDPDAFEDPDRFDVGRGASSHLSLGRGIHHCLGAPLARLEGRLVLEMLLERFASIRLLDDRPRFRTGIVFRGLYGLPLRCTPA